MLHRTNSFSCFQIVSLFRCTITHRFAKWYKITLLSNDTGTLTANIFVLLPYENTLLSNRRGCPLSTSMFYYLMKLHYSQTQLQAVICTQLFYYLMKLHYSQTSPLGLRTILPFYYLMKLHYSQTLPAAQ